MTSNGVPQTGAPEAWIAINCGHEVQINDSPEVPGNDPRKTGSIYGFADVDLARARPRRRRLERPGGPRRRTALHGDPQRGGHQPVREPAWRAGARPPARSGLRLARSRGVRRSAESWRAAGRRVVPPDQGARASGLTRARRGADTRCDDAARRARGERSARLTRSAGGPAAERDGGAGRNRARPPAPLRQPCRRPDARGAPRPPARPAAGAAADPTRRGHRRRRLRRAGRGDRPRRRDRRALLDVRREPAARRRDRVRRGAEQHRPALGAVRPQRAPAQRGRRELPQSRRRRRAAHRPRAGRHDGSDHRRARLRGRGHPGERLGRERPDRAA